MPYLYRWRLADLAEARGLASAAELARRLDGRGIAMSRSQTHRMMTGRPARLSLDVAVALCEILDCSLDDLIDHDDSPPQPGGTASPRTGRAAGRPSAAAAHHRDVHAGIGSSDDDDDVVTDIDDDDPRTRNLLGAVTLEVSERTEHQIVVDTRLSPVEATALTSLANVADGHGIDELRGMVGLSQPGCARLVDRLAARGLVLRGVDAQDRRVVTVRLTATGRATVPRILRARETAVASMLTGVPAADRATLARGLAEVARVTVDGRPEISDRFCRRCDPRACGFPHRCPATVFSSRDG